jgi:hypothetical protein
VWRNDEDVGFEPHIGRRIRRRLLRGGDLRKRQRRKAVDESHTQGHWSHTDISPDPGNSPGE